MKETDEIKFVKSVGIKIRELRNLKGLSQEALSIDAEIPENQIGRIERGEVNTTIKTLYKICKALDCQIKDLF